MILFRIMMEYPVTAKMAAKRLGLSAPTLNRWLVEDQRRAPECRLFEFHRMRGGQKRVWSEEGFAALEAAIDRESRPGGALCHWRARAAVGALTDGDPDAAHSMEAVLRYRA
jgi:hypothetical protein